MENNVITSDPPATAQKSKKSKMSAAGRKAVSEAAKARWAARKALPNDVDRIDYYRQNPDGTYTKLKGHIDNGEGMTAAPPVLNVPTAPLPPSPAVLQLQAQVVDMVSQRGEARSRLTEAHAAYLLAQSKFQAAEAELKGIESEVSYRIGLIAQLENRPAQVANAGYASPSPALQMPPSLGSITSEPAQVQQQPNRSQEPFAVGSADDLRRDIRGHMGMM